jgi:hypothetical protein
MNALPIAPGIAEVERLTLALRIATLIQERDTAALDERRRIEGELKEAGKTAFDRGGQALPDVAIQAAGLLAAELCGRADDFAKRAEEVVLRLPGAVANLTEEEARPH